MEFRKLDTKDKVFFYEQEFYCLSNFSSFRLTWRSIDFDTSEHAYHWEKFDAGNTMGTIVQSEIRKARSAHDAYKIAASHKSCQRINWDVIKLDVMSNILRAKVRQHEYVKQKLLETGDRILIEDSWRDEFWGTGVMETGENHLGRLWMEIRKELLANGCV